MEVFTQSTGFFKSAGAAIIAGPLTGAKIALLKEPVNIQENATEVAAKEATYQGYARQTVTWSGASRADDGSWEFLGQHPEFRPGDATVPNLITGAALFSADGTNVLAVANRLSPTPMNDTGDAILFVLRYRPDAGMFYATFT